jgi:hypothetical protein
MNASIKVRFVVEVELERGSTFVEAAEVSESIAAVLIQNREVRHAELVAIERVSPKYEPIAKGDDDAKA